MKKYFNILIVLTVVLFATTAIPGVFQHTNYPNGFPNGVTIQDMPILNTYGGTVYWVDGPAGTGTGSNGNKGTFSRPWATIDYAIGRCLAGDIIMVKEGHTEAVVAASGIDYDVAGIAVVGLGNGRNRPTITFTTLTTADIDIDSANVTISNFIFDMTGVDALAAGIDVNAAGFRLMNSDIIIGDAAGQALYALLLDANADRMTFDNVKVVGSTDTGTWSAISMGATAPDEVHILNSVFIGDFSNSAIFGSSTPTNMIISGNYVRNFQDGDHAIEFTSTATGIISDNDLATSAIGTALDPGTCEIYDTLWYDDDHPGDAVGIPVFEASAGAVGGSEARVVEVTQTTIATGDLFAVAGGPIKILDIGGYVTAGIQNTSNQIKLTVDPTNPATNTDLCLVVNIQAASVGTVLNITGTVANAMTETLNGVILGQAGTIICPIGMIEVTAAGTATGTIEWFLRYEPLTPGVTVTAQ